MNTNVIPTKTHGYIDYITSASLIALPLIFSGRKKGSETYLPMLIGAGALVQSLLTNYELGAKKDLKMRNHLNLDYLNGAVMTAAPFLLGFYKKSWVPHVAIGLSELAIAMLTKKKKKKKFMGIFG